LPAQQKTAVDALQTMGLNMYVVDILRANSGPVVIQVNSSSDLNCNETTTGKDGTSMIIQFLVKIPNPTITKRGERTKDRPLNNPLNKSFKLMVSVSGRTKKDKQRLTLQAM
jgi:hypothetical protein